MSRRDSQNTPDVGGAGGGPRRISQDTRRVPPEIEAKLRRVKARIRWRSLAAGILNTGAVFIALSALAMAIDRVLYLEIPHRLIVSGVAFLVTAAVLLRTLWMPLARRLDLVDLAGLVERRRPVFRERLLSTVELTRSTDPDEIRGSERLVEALTRDTSRIADPIRFERIVSLERVARLGAVVTPALGAFAFAFLLWPARMANLAERYAMPWREIPRYSETRLGVEPGDRLVRLGDTISVRATARRRVPPRAVVELRPVEGGTRATSFAMVRGEERGIFTTDVTVDRSLRYRVLAGDARSPWYTLTAIPAPRVGDLSARLEYPEYTGLAPVEIRRLGTRVEALRGTGIELRFTPAGEVERAEVEWKAPEGGAGDDSTGPADMPGAARRTDAGFYTFETIARSSARFRIRLVDRNGFENRNPRWYDLRVKPDRIPEVRILEPHAPITVPRTDTVLVEWAAKDDFALTSAELHSEIEGEPGPPIALELEGTPATFRGEVPLRLSSLPLGDLPRQKVVIWIRVRDSFPGPPEQTAESERREIIVDDTAKTLAGQLREKVFQDLAGAFQRIIERLKSEKSDVDALRREPARGWADEKRGPVLQGRVASVEAAETKTRALVQELAGFLDADAVYEQLGPPVRAVADEEITRSIGEIGAARKERDSGERGSQLGRSSGEIQTAVEKLEDLAGRLGILHRFEDAGMELADAAARQSELADLAEAPGADPSDLLQEEAGILADTSGVVQDTPELQQGLLARQAPGARQAALDVDRLASLQRSMVRQVRAQASLDQAARAIQDFAREQEALNREASPLGQENVDQPMADALEGLRAGRYGDAVQDQEDAEFALENAARQARTRAGLDLAARGLELAERQDGLRSRTQDERPPAQPAASGPQGTSQGEQRPAEGSARPGATGPQEGGPAKDKAETQRPQEGKPGAEGPQEGGPAEGRSDTDGRARINAIAGDQKALAADTRQWETDVRESRALNRMPGAAPTKEMGKALERLTRMRPDEAVGPQAEAAKALREIVRALEDLPARDSRRRELAAQVRELLDRQEGLTSRTREVAEPGSSSPPAEQRAGLAQLGREERGIESDARKLTNEADRVLREESSRVPVRPENALGAARSELEAARVEPAIARQEEGERDLDRLAKALWPEPGPGSAGEAGPVVAGRPGSGEQGADSSAGERGGTPPAPDGAATPAAAGRGDASLSPEAAAARAEDLAGRQRDLRRRVEQAMRPVDQASRELAAAQAQTADVAGGLPDDVARPEDLARSFSGDPGERAQALAQREGAVGGASKRLADMMRSLQQALAPVVPDRAKRLGLFGEVLGEAVPRITDAASGHLGEGRLDEAAPPMQRAAQGLEAVARELGQLAREAQAAGAAPGGTPEGGASSGHLADAFSQMAQAESQLAGGTPSSQGAASSMRGAAQSLQSAAQSLLGQLGQGGQAAGQTGQPGGRPGQSLDGRGTTVNLLPTIVRLSDLEKPLPSKDWGRLPGHLKAALLQALRERYPREYARIIQLYFQEVGEEGGR